MWVRGRVTKSEYHVEVERDYGTPGRADPKGEGDKPGLGVALHPTQCGGDEEVRLGDLEACSVGDHFDQRIPRARGMLH